VETLREHAHQLRLVKPESDLRVVARWRERLAVLADSKGNVAHATLALHNTRPLYDAESRHVLEDLLSHHLNQFLLKFELEPQPSGFVFAHGHLLLPWEPEALNFLKGMWAYGAKEVRLTYKGEKLPSALSRVRSFVDIPDLSPLEAFFSFRDSTIAVLRSSDDLARYLAKRTFVGGLPPLIKRFPKRSA